VDLERVLFITLLSWVQEQELRESKLQKLSDELQKAGQGRFEDITSFVDFQEKLLEKIDPGLLSKPEESLDLYRKIIADVDDKPGLEQETVHKTVKGLGMTIWSPLHSPSNSLLIFPKQNVCVNDAYQMLSHFWQSYKIIVEKKIPQLEKQCKDVLMNDNADNKADNYAESISEKLERLKDALQSFNDEFKKLSTYQPDERTEDEVEDAWDSLRYLLSQLQHVRAYVGEANNVLPDSYDMEKYAALTGLENKIKSRKRKGKRRKQ